MNYFHFLHILSAASYACFGSSILLWPLKHQHPVGSSGQGTELQLQQDRHFHPMHVLAHQSLPVRHCSAGFHPMLFSSWKARIIWVLFWCYPSALILGSYLKGLMILQWSHGTLTHGPRFSSRFHHQPPHCSRPVLLLSCPTTTSTHFLVLQPTTSSSGNWKYHFSHWSCCLLIISQWIWSILMLFILMFTNLSFWWSSLAWLSYNYANFLFAKGCGFYFFSPAIFEGSCYSQHVLYSNGFPNHKHKTKIWHFKI